MTSLRAGETEAEGENAFYFVSGSVGGAERPSRRGDEKDEEGKGTNTGNGKEERVFYTWGGGVTKHMDAETARAAKYDGKSGGNADSGPKREEPGRQTEKDERGSDGKMRTIRYEGGAEARRDQIVTERGKTYRHCELIEADAHGLTFRHRDGMAKVGYGDMRREMQAEFGYSAEAEKAARRERAEKARERSKAGILLERGVGSYGYGGSGGSYGVGGYGRLGLPPIGAYVYTARPGSTNPNFATNTLRQIVAYRNNGYSNISLSEQLFNQHFAAHSGVVYGSSQLRPAVIAAPPYMPYVRNIYPRQIGTFAAGPSGGGLVPTLRSGYSQAGSIAPSLVPATRR